MKRRNELSTEHDAQCGCQWPLEDSSTAGAPPEVDCGES